MKRASVMFAAAGSLFFLPSAVFAQSRPPARSSLPPDALEALEKMRVASAEGLAQVIENKKRPPTLPPWVANPPKTPYRNPIVSIPIAEQSHLDTAFAFLAKQYNVAVFAEGVPFMPELSPVQQETLTSDLVRDNTLEFTVTTIAAAYDYDAVRTGESTFLLFKRYTNPNDLPYVTFDEAMAAFQNIKRVTSALDPHVIPSREKNSPLLALHADLLQTLGEKTFADGVPIYSLAPTQQTLLYQYATYGYLSDAFSYAQQNLHFLQTSQADNAVFRRLDLFGLGIPVLIYEGNFFPQFRTPAQQYAISHNFTIQIGGANEVQTVGSVGKKPLHLIYLMIWKRCRNQKKPRPQYANGLARKRFPTPTRPTQQKPNRPSPPVKH